MNIVLSCEMCGVVFPSWSAWAKKRKHHYCSKTCKDKHHSILFGSGEIKSDYYKRYHLEHREERLAKAKERRLARPDEKREYDALRRKVCGKEINKARRLAYLEKRCWDQTIFQMVRAAKGRAKKQGVPFDITVEDIVIPEKCPALGIPLNWNIGRGKDDSPSLDKIIPNRGYVKGNVAVISARANKIKHNASLEGRRPTKPASCNAAHSASLSKRLLSWSQE